MRESISVVIPNYNQAHFLDRQVPAFLRQSRPPDEILVIDDGSTDDSVAHISALARKYPQVRLVVNEVNCGVINSVNRGIQEARGELLSMFGCDDVPLQGYLEQSAAMMEKHPQAAACVGNPLFWYEHADMAEEIEVQWASSSTFFPPDEAARKLRVPMYIHTGGGLVRRSRLREIGGYDPALEAYADWFAWLTLIFRHGCCYIPSPFQLYCVRSSSYLATMGKDDYRIIKALRAAMRKVLFGECRDVMPEFVTSSAFSVGRENAVLAVSGDPDLLANDGKLLIQKALADSEKGRSDDHANARVRFWYANPATFSLETKTPFKVRIRRIYSETRHLANRTLPKSLRDRFRSLMHRLEGRKPRASKDS